MSFNINHIFYSPVIEGPTDPVTPADPEESATSETENNKQNKIKKNLITVLKNFLSKLTGTTIQGNNLVEVINNSSNALNEVSGSTSDLILDVSKLAKPTINGVEYDAVVTDVDGPSIMENCFICDTIPPLAKSMIKDAIIFSTLEYYSFLAIPATESDSGDMMPYLINSVTVYEVWIGGNSYVLFPSTAQFALKKYDIPHNDNELA